MNISSCWAESPLVYSICDIDGLDYCFTGYTVKDGLIQYFHYVHIGMEHTSKIRLKTRMSRHCGSNPGKGNRLLSFPNASRTDPESTQLPIQSAPGALLSAVIRPGREVNHSALTSAEGKNEWC